MRRRSRFLFAGSVGLALLILGYSLYWVLMAHYLANLLRDPAQLGLGPGIELSLTPSEIEGFPFAFRAELTDLRLTLSVPDNLVVLGAAKVAARAPSWNPYRLEFVAQGPIGIDTIFAGDGIAIRTIDAGSGSLQFDWRRRGDLAELTGDFADLGFHLAPQRDVTLAKLGFGLVLPADPPADYHEPLAEFRLSAADIAMPNYRLGLGAGPIEDLAFRAQMMGPVPKDLPLDRALGRWRDDGGVLEIRDFRFAQKPLRLTAAGTFALDRDLQPTGSADFTAYGLKETIEALRADGLISARDATASLLALGAFAKPDAAGIPRIAAGISIEEGMIWLGPLPLAPLPHFVWSSPPAL